MKSTAQFHKKGMRTPPLVFFLLIRVSSAAVVCDDTAAAAASPSPNLPLIYVVTPTFRHREQLPSLLRLAQTLSHVPSLVWVVAEEAATCSSIVSRALRGLDGARLAHAHLAAPLGEKHRRARIRPREVAARNAALEWIEARHNSSGAPSNAVAYFADDDNAYDLRLFEEIRRTERVGVWPVGLIGKTSLSTPVLVDGEVAGFSDPWFHYRKFPVDMAGFAFHVDLLLRTKARVPSRIGVEEDLFLQALGVDPSEVEPKASGCTEILVWQTRTIPKKVPRLRVEKALSEVAGSNLPRLLRNLEESGAAVVDNESAFRRDLQVCLGPEACFSASH